MLMDFGRGCGLGAWGETYGVGTHKVRNKASHNCFASLYSPSLLSTNIENMLGHAPPSDAHNTVYWHLPHIFHLPHIQEQAGGGYFDAVHTFSPSLACKCKLWGGFMAFWRCSHLLHLSRTQDRVCWFLLPFTPPPPPSSHATVSWRWIYDLRCCLRLLHPPSHARARWRWTI